MNGINKVIYEAISVKDPKEGKYGQWWGSGIKVNGEWHNGILNSQNKVDYMLANKGKEIELFFYEDEQYGNQYRLPTDKDRKEAPKVAETIASPSIEHAYQSPEIGLLEALKRIEALEVRVAELELITTGKRPKEDTPITDEIEQGTKEPDYVNRDDIPNEDESKLPF